MPDLQTSRPAVGRIVHYFVADARGTLIPRPAIVVQAVMIAGECFATLFVMEPGFPGVADGETYFERAVRYSSTPEIHCWSWPPGEAMP